MFVQLVNYASFPQTVALTISNTTGLSNVAILTTLAGTGPYDTNSFDEPLKVCSTCHMITKGCLRLSKIVSMFCCLLVARAAVEGLPL